MSTNIFFLSISNDKAVENKVKIANSEKCNYCIIQMNLWAKWGRGGCALGWAPEPGVCDPYYINPETVYPFQLCCM